MSDKPSDRMMSPAARNGMTDAEWNALSPDAQKWRTDHPTHAGTSDAPAAHAGPMDDDRPGHAPEAAAPSGAVPAATPGLSPPGQGAQVILTGDAQAAARGGLHGTIERNTAARDEAIADGHVVKGTTAAAADDATGAQGAEAEAAERALWGLGASRPDAEAAERVRRGNTGAVPPNAEAEAVRRSNADADAALARKRDAEKAKRKA